MQAEIQSPSLGRLILDDEEMPDHPCYIGKVPFGQHGEVEVSLACLEGRAGDWAILFARAELIYPELVAREPILLQEAKERILDLHNDYFESEWKGSSDVLIGTLKLNNWNVFDDGSIELWYEGGEEFHHLDVNLNMDSEMRLSEVRFDG